MGCSTGFTSGIQTWGCARIFVTVPTHKSGKRTAGDWMAVDMYNYGNDNFWVRSGRDRRDVRLEFGTC